MSCANCGREGHTASECTHVKRVEGLSDSAEREEFVTGMIREPNLMRGRYDLISPISMHHLALSCGGYDSICLGAIDKLAIHYERGSMKYAPRNWELGGYIGRYLNSAIRHIQRYITGCRTEDHLSAVMWNCFCIIHTIVMVRSGKLRDDLLDLPGYDVTVPIINTTNYTNEHMAMFRLIIFMINPSDLSVISDAAMFAMRAQQEDLDNESRL